jgi:enoyl-CoA hydratase
MGYKHIIYQPGKVARIILNRPRYYNAQSTVMREEMDDAFAAASKDDAVGCIVLSGTGDHFSAGHDLGTKEEQEDRAQRNVPQDRYHRYDTVRASCMENSLRWRNVPKPTIAMVHGYCIFGGWIFAAAMDLIFASEDALFLPSHTQYFTVPWDIGYRRAKEIMFEHRFVTAWEALEYGMVNRVYPNRETLEKETFSYAERVADNWLKDPIRIRTMKFSINHMMDTMGYTPEIEVAYQSYFIATELRDPATLKDDKGGIANVTGATKNLELDKPWLERMRRRG